jgi:hypothetical protein
LRAFLDKNPKTKKPKGARSHARLFSLVQKENRTKMDDHVYMPPADCEDDTDDTDDDVAAERTQQPRLCTFLYDVATFRDEDDTLLLRACDATLARKRALRAAGGAWTVVRIREGLSCVGWLFSSADAARAIDVLRAPP